jgi:multimeric flavodoxin WrbA
MKVLMINGSPRKDGNTSAALGAMCEVFAKNGIECEQVQIGAMDIRGCVCCGYCFKNGKCAVDDIVNQLAEKFRDADGLVIASPVYYASPNGTLLSLLDRLFYSASFDKRMKVGASVVAARRGGLATAYDVLNKYFGISGMPIATSTYWNDVHGRRPGEAVADEAGMQTMRSLAENMTFLMRSIALGKEKYGLPEAEKKIFTSFVK